MGRRELVVGLLIAIVAAATVIGCEKKGESYTVYYTYGEEYTIVVNQGKSFSLNDIPVKDGYVFDGLYDAEIGGNKYVGADGVSVRPFTEGKDITLFVRFLPRTYAFEFCYDEGTLSYNGTRSAEYGNGIADLPTLTVGEHRIFKGWYTAVENGEKVANDNGQVIDEYKVFDYTKYEQGENYAVKLYAAIGYESVSVKFFNEVSGNKILLEERMIEYSTNIVQASLGIKVGSLDVVCWTLDGEEVVDGQINGDCELKVYCLGKAVNLETQSGMTVVSGDDANILLYGDKDKTYENINISISDDSLTTVHIVMYNANIVGNPMDSTISSIGERQVKIYSLGTHNSIIAKADGAPAVKVNGISLDIYCDADLDIRGGDGTNGEDAGSRGGNGGVGIYAENLEIYAGNYSVAINGGKGGNAYNRHYSENDGEGSNGRAGFSGGNGGNGVIVAEKFTLVSGNVSIIGGDGGDGGHGSECNRSEITNKGYKDVVGGSGGDGGHGGEALYAKTLTLSGGNLNVVGGNGGDTGKAGGVHDGDTRGFVAFVGITTASDGSSGMAGKGGSAISNNCSIEGNRSEITETQGGNGMVTAGTNRN